MLVVRVYPTTCTSRCFYVCLLLRMIRICGGYSYERFAWHCCLGFASEFHQCRRIDESKDYNKNMKIMAVWGFSRHFEVQ
ncbi:hypothetical protein BJ165DRAFT_1467224 [Panaeolus papilionaceus]|nr:hypothetical protein BJ165DRAFT_1467224 [Panaeolus papilionaceus]